MKRLVTLGITLALVMGLFCFSVNAETVIQGTNDTVTASYGNNDITIALKARKLRVINTGTAAAGYAGYTPVIVTITIYNLGNQNCLINNLKFKLSSSSAEYTIADYDNISTDLFIADSAYDSNGFISIHASNNYTYSGGIVCPANSNMTYVGIINVSANWITENQTWRSVDLSSADFYSNMTTTIGDYPCDAEPVDISNIESDLDSLVNTIQGMDYDLSTIHSLVSDLVSGTIYTGSNPSYSFPSTGSNSASLTNSPVSDFSVTATRNTGMPYLIDSDIELNAYTDTAIQNATIRYPIVLTVTVQNNTGKVLRQYYSNRVNGVFPLYMAANISIEYFKSNVYDYFYVSRGGYLQLNSKFHDDNYYVFIPEGTSTLTMYMYLDVPYGTSITFPSMDLNNWFSVNPTLIDDYYLPTDEYTILRDLYLAYSSVNGINDLSDAASDASDQAAIIHNQEASYYAQNQAAIEATGLSNYQFSGEQSNGIGAVSNDFTALWNALGSWNSVYIFSMTLTLALTILRHVPNRRKPKEKNSE